MILVDTSVWVNHFRSAEETLKCLLLDENVLCHPFIVGELACGNLKNRNSIIELLNSLPQSQTITNEEFHFFLESNQLMGLGIGFVAIHLLGSAKMAKSLLWTQDKRLNFAAQKLGISYAH